MIHVFLVNPIVENEEYAKQLKKDLENYKSIQYFIFNVRDNSSTDAVVKRILKYLNDDVLRFYVVGGTATLHRVLNAVDGHLNSVEIAWIPVGHSDAFLHNFNDNENAFLSLDAQINGHARPIDYIRTNHGLAINSISCGVDTTILKMMHRVSEFPSLSRQIHILFLTTVSVFFSKNFRCGFVMDNNINYPLSPKRQFYMGNGAYVSELFSFKNNSKINDGIGEFLIDYEFSFFSIFKKLRPDALESGLFYKNAQLGKCNKIRFVSDDPINLCMDGILYENLTDVEACIVPNQLMFVLPDTVSI